MEQRKYLFADFTLDVVNKRLLHGQNKCELDPKCFDVLQYLVERVGNLVTNDELLDKFWPGKLKEESGLGGYIRAIRNALKEDAKNPRFVKTVPTHGYQFEAKDLVEARHVSQREPKQTPAPPLLAGRDTELGLLKNWFGKALSEKRQIVFVTGPAGIGKTTLMEAFAASLAATKERWVGHGQCVQPYGAGEPYLPVLEALSQLCCEPGGDRLIALLDQYAPTWLVQMPALRGPADFEALQRKTLGATHERMLREMVEALEAMAAERPLVLLLEDLQWGDDSTLQLLNALSRRRANARLLVLATYRPGEVLERDRSLTTIKEELQVHGLCQELMLDVLNEQAVREYLAMRFQKHELPDHVSEYIHAQTYGNPLFMANVTQHLVDLGIIGETAGRWRLNRSLDNKHIGTPKNIELEIQRQFSRLSGEEKILLQAASVVGKAFSAAAATAGIDRSVVHVEECCEKLVQRGYFLRALGTEEWPNGTVANRYQLIHDLYREFIYNRIPAAKRSELHQQIGIRLEEGYGARSSEIAAQLAMHFEEGRDYHRAVQYCQKAAETALYRSGYQEVLQLAEKGLKVLQQRFEMEEDLQQQQELLLRTTLGIALSAVRGFADPDVEKCYTRAWELCQLPSLIPSANSTRVLRGLFSYYLVRGDLQIAQQLGQQLLSLSEHTRDQIDQLEAVSTLGFVSFYQGALLKAQQYLTQGHDMYGAVKSRLLLHVNVQDPGVDCLCILGLGLWTLGYPVQAIQTGLTALSLARERKHPFSEAYASFCVAALYCARHEASMSLEHAEKAVALGTEHGFPFCSMLGRVFQGWALAQSGNPDEGIAQLIRGVDALQQSGVGLLHPFLLGVLGGLYFDLNQMQESYTVINKALDFINRKEDSGRVFEAELHRLKGELILRMKGGRSEAQGKHEAEQCFLKAIEIARQQQAKSLELRAVTSLGRLWQNQGKKEEARQLLAEIYGWFTEGFDTRDLKEAKALLEEFV